MPIIRALATAVSGRAIIEFLNDWDREVRIEDAFASPQGGTGNMASLVTGPLIVRPNERVRVDVSSALCGLFGRNQNLVFTIQLVLDPEPPTQPPPAFYSAELANGGFDYFGRPRGS
jgi:hypothetical protein